jgi:ADP-ribose pyrophosphatase
VKIKERKTVYNGFFRVEQVTLEHQGKELERDLVIPKNGVAALVFDTVKKEYILIEQYRLPAERPLIEIVAGLLDKENEKPEDTIVREIEEEAGYEVDKLEFIRCFFPTPGSFAERIWLYYAEVSHKVSEGGGVDSEHENIKTVSYTPEKLFEADFEDAKTLIAVLWKKCKALS